MLNNTNRIIAPDREYPNKGFLYLADSARMRELGYMKYGQTMRTADKRKDGHPGGYECDPGEILFEIAVLDARSAETLAKALFKNAGLHLSVRKEFIERDLPRAIAILRQAQALHVPVTAFAPAANKHCGFRVSAGHVAWDTLLHMPLELLGEVKPLGAWLAESLTSNRIRKRLEKFQVWCINPDAIAPEFELKQLSNQWATWLESQGRKVQGLLSKQGDLYFKGRIIV